jgi:DNA-binding NtrC family response regulator
MKRPKILVVDDDSSILETFKSILERKKYDVEIFFRPSEALEYLNKERVDLILSDLQMPEMDGVQFLYQVKKIAPAVPVVLITAHASIETAVSAIQQGAFDYLSKPLDIKKIYAVVEKALARR